MQRSSVLIHRSGLPQRGWRRALYFPPFLLFAKALRRHWKRIAEQEVEHMDLVGGNKLIHLVSLFVFKKRKA